jgi:DNA-binding XRE family transcriptional regulator
VVNLEHKRRYWLIDARNLAHLTQKELGEEAGVSSQAISKYENGEATPRPKIGKKICSVLNNKHSDNDLKLIQFYE